jgi:predicted RNA polymerase sigma factor
VTSAAAHRAVEAVWRIEAVRLIAGLARLVVDVGRAEDLAQDALVAALEQWPTSGVPDRPGAWLMSVARRRAVAVSMADGPAAALDLGDGLEGGLDSYHLLPSVRADLLARLGRPAGARAEFERAAGLTANERERDLLLARAQECA